MRLTSIKAGDIVRVDGSHAHVLDKARGKLVITWVGRANGARTIGARAIEAHWKRSRS